MTTELMLAGLPAENPLGFMAALGTLVTTRRIWSKPEERDRVQLAWRQAMGGWRPALRVPGDVTREQLVALLHGALRREVDAKARERASAALKDREQRSSQLKAALKKLKALGKRATKADREALIAEEIDPARQALGVASAAYRSALEAGGAPDPALSLGANLKQASGEAFADVARAWAEAAAPADRRLADLASAYGCEAILDDDGNLEPTQFSKHNGAGGRSMLEDIGKLMVQVGAPRLSAALFEPWDYSDEKYGLGWDPADARAHAHMGENPERSGSLTMHGANLLAFEGLQLCPAVPDRGRLTTTGTEQRDGARVFSWPIWTPWLGADAVRSVVAMEAVQEPLPDRGNLERLGIREVYRAEHFTFGKYPRFRPARSA